MNMHKNEMSNAELAILGLVAQGPKYGYQLEEDIVQYGMREWTEIGFSSIYYVLNKMESAGWLSSEMHNEGERPARKVYRLTGPGWRALHDAVLQRLAGPRPRSGDFDLALANLPALTADEITAALQNYQNTLAVRLAQVMAKREQDARQDMPPHVRALFGHSTHALQAELAWVEEYLLKQGEC
jgi:DNA-binding PadR family transcriptional regulator